MHRGMECLDFKSLCDIDTKDQVAVSAFVKKSMDEMLKKGLITDDMYRLTRPKLIEQFISSDVAAVSYTHLDVYKRQLQELRGFCYHSKDT